MPDKLQIRFVRADLYRDYPVSGVWGGVSSNGDVHAQFYVEKGDVPEAIDVEVEGQVGREGSRHGGKDIIREVQAGFLIRPDTAYSIGKWLIEKARVAGFSPEEQGDQ